MVPTVICDHKGEDFLPGRGFEKPLWSKGQDERRIIVRPACAERCPLAEGNGEELTTVPPVSVFIDSQKRCVQPAVTRRGRGQTPRTLWMERYTARGRTCVCESVATGEMRGDE
ncbi:hypothetical protein DPEC_G00122600 [Dallia pectoralis]|uniref:Uncharacterized protein n=1 Tax=Dallia pectoralis TaxID=75939 RepID=A0ACC2GR20_DALPE|nr:hypothetical protein DPEC_G00122600 [Dallia pectoralis]